MSFFNMGKERYGDRGLDKQAATKSRGQFLILVLGLGVVASLVFFGGDIWFTYAPLAPILGDYMAWAAAIITTPIQVAATVIFGSREGREVYKRDDPLTYGFMVVLTIMSVVVDIGSNIWGLFDAMEATGTQVTILSGVVVAGFGAVMAVIEIVIGFFVQAVAVQIQKVKVASEILERAEKRTGRQDQRRPSQSRARPPVGQHPDSHPRSREGRFVSGASE